VIVLFTSVYHNLIGNLQFRSPSVSNTFTDNLQIISWTIWVDVTDTLLFGKRKRFW